MTEKWTAGDGNFDRINDDEDGWATTIEIDGVASIKITGRTPQEAISRRDRILIAIAAS